MRILQVCVDLDGGGIDRYLYNYCTRIDGIQFDFAIVDNKKDGILERPLTDHGCNIFRVPRMSNGLMANYRALKEIIRKNRYDAVHVHLGSKSILALLCAKNCGIKTRIVHAHIAFIPETQKERIVRKALTIITKFLATDLAACGIDAAKWVWGERTYADNKTVVQNNAIDTAKYQYDAQVRKTYRENLGFSDHTLVVGHVGRLCDQKNQLRLLDIFAEIHKQRKDSCLVLIGRGEQQQLVAEKAKNLGIDDVVRLLGVREDVACLLNAMDVFVFPSKYEGLPFTLIETQCNGLPAIVADTITPLVRVSNCASFMSLEASNDQWAHAAMVVGEQKHDITACDCVIEAGYDIDTEALKLKKYYIERISQQRE